MSTDTHCSSTPTLPLVLPPNSHFVVCMYECLNECVCKLCDCVWCVSVGAHTQARETRASRSSFMVPHLSFCDRVSH